LNIYYGRKCYAKNEGGVAQDISREGTKIRCGQCSNGTKLKSGLELRLGYLKSTQRIQFQDGDAKSKSVRVSRDSGLSPVYGTSPRP
jgi:hypothetical protein